MQAVHLTLQNGDGSTEQVSASWVIGADGAHSAMRRLVGTKLAGSFVGERFLLGDVDAEHQLDLDSHAHLLLPRRAGGGAADARTGGCGFSPRCTTRPEPR